jgi:phage/plasmid-like protein (TIGR03299 family)
MAHELTKSYATGEYRMAYRKRTDADKPWHDDETKCKAWTSDPTLPEVLHDLEAYVDVVKRPIFDCNGELIPEMQETWRPHCDTLGNTMLDEKGVELGQRLGLVGPKYELIQDHEVVNWFAPWVDAGAISIETGGALFNGSRFWVLGKLNQDPKEVVPGDEVNQHILVLNGHDGKISFRAFPTNVRVVCNNTLNVALKSGLTKKYKARHNHLVKVKADLIRSEIADLQQLFDESVDKFKVLAGANVKDEDQLKLYFQKVLKEDVQEEDAGKEYKDDSKRPLPTLIRLFEEGVGQNLPGVSGTWWAAFNAVSEFITHVRGRNSDARLDNMVLGVGNLLSERAINLGLAAAGGQLLQAN